MSRSFEQAGSSVIEVMAKVMFDHRSDLMAIGVKVSIVFTTKTDADGVVEPGIMVRGIPAAAKIQITSVVDRARGMADAKILVDRSVWDELDDEERAALIDHELTHLEIREPTAEGDTLDGAGRPRLKIRPHDWEVAGFADVVKRHGRKALDFQQVARFRERHGQLLLWVDEPVTK
jgi:hypothetical protein